MPKPQSVVTLDPIAQNNRRRSGVVGRWFKTRRFKGKGIKPLDPFGHYLFTGRQGGGKSLSFLWYYEYLVKRYTKKNKKVVLFDNMGISENQVQKFTLSNKIRSCEYKEDTIYIFLIDELQAWFPKDTKDQATLKEIDKLTGDFSQLRKRSIYVLSTAQIYGRVNKNLREQCLYMVACRKSKITNKLVNDFIDGDDILCDDLGRWSGEPVKILVHGLPTTKYDTHKIIV